MKNQGRHTYDIAEFTHCVKCGSIVSKTTEWIGQQIAFKHKRVRRYIQLFGLHCYGCLSSLICLARVAHTLFELEEVNVAERIRLYNVDNCSDDPFEYIKKPCFCYSCFETIFPLDVLHHPYYTSVYPPVLSRPQKEQTRVKRKPQTSSHGRDLDARQEVENKQGDLLDRWNDGKINLY